jgi:hypothetical protein
MQRCACDGWLMRIGTCSILLVTKWLISFNVFSSLPASRQDPEYNKKPVYLHLLDNDQCTSMSAYKLIFRRKRTLQNTNYIITTPPFLLELKGNPLHHIISEFGGFPDHPHSPIICWMKWLQTGKRGALPDGWGREGLLRAWSPAQRSLPSPKSPESGSLPPTSASMFLLLVKIANHRSEGVL